MKTYTKTINTYSIKELQGEAEEKAINTVVEHMANDFYEIDVPEIHATLEAFAYDVGIDLLEVNIDLYNGAYSYAKFDLDQLADTGNPFKNEMVAKINERVSEGYYDYAYLTGSMYDSLIQTYFASNYPKGITYNDLFKVLAELGDYVVNTTTDHYTDVLANEFEITYYATNLRQYEFLEDGSVYAINV